MKNKIEDRLQKMKKEKRMGLMSHVIVGYPNLEATMGMVRAMDKEGVDFVELQIPFSDPLADGPTIMKACERALENGTKVKDAFKIATLLTQKVSSPLLFMAYFNTVFKYGVEKFCFDSKKAGISGLIVPDMPIEEEEGEGFTKAAKKYGLYIVRVISPASTIERIKKNIKMADGFIYCTSRQGTTGNQRSFDPKTIKYLENVRKYSNVPLALGFGIKSPEDAQMGKKYADIVVVGSAIVKIAEEYNGDKLLGKVGDFVRSLRV